MACETNVTKGHRLYAKREFLLVEGIQQTKSYSVMAIDATTGNDPMRQQEVETIIFYKWTERPLQKRFS